MSIVAGLKVCAYLCAIKDKKMKNILLFLFLFTMFLLGVKNTNGTLPEEGVGVESVLQADAPMGYVLPVVTEWPQKSEASVNADSLVRQFRICVRGQRQLPVQYVSFAKNLAYQSAKKRLELLFHSIERTYTSLPFQSWSVSSDHYVFGIRRILI